MSDLQRPRLSERDLDFVIETAALLHQNLNAAKKPVSFVSEHYLHYKRQRLFGVDAGQ
ncbi:MAG: hypothetical protein HYX92_08570 [Chloroflexi bacterium]|nr:hypothetical protein [Chloroflexota bacterium]